MTVDWGDGNTEIFTEMENVSHTFLTVGKKTVTISGSLSHYGNSNNKTGKERLTKVKAWGGLGLKKLSYAFNNAKILESVPSTLPTTVEDLSGMFNGAIIFNHPIGTWVTTNVKHESFVF